MSHLQQQAYPRDRSHRGFLPITDGSDNNTDFRSSQPTNTPFFIPPHNHEHPQQQPLGFDLQSTSTSGFASEELRSADGGGSGGGEDGGGGGGGGNIGIGNNFLKHNGNINNGGTAASPSLLAYTYSPLEHSTGGGVFDSWHKLPGAAVANAAADGLMDVVLGDRGRGENGYGVAKPASSQQSKTYRLAVKRTVMSILASFAFGFATAVFRGRQSGLEFMAGYLVEQSLSVDNLFVFLMTFDYFQVPLEHQGRVLTWGIVGAILMRGVMIAFGVAVMTRFRWITIVFAGILLVSSYKLLAEVDDDNHDLSQNTLVRMSKRLVGAVDEYDGDRFFTKMGGKGKTVATPLLLCLVCIELSDFVFAVDSIPAVLGVSEDPFVVFSSNLFAIMALRSMYVIIAQAVNQLPYLKPAVALVLGFVGVKMLLEFVHVKISIGKSLFVIAFIIGGGVGLSVLARRGWTAPRAVSRHKRRNSGEPALRSHNDEGGAIAFV